MAAFSHIPSELRQIIFSGTDSLNQLRRVCRDWRDDVDFHMTKKAVASDENGTHKLLGRLRALEHLHLAKGTSDYLLTLSHEKVSKLRRVELREPVFSRNESLCFALRQLDDLKELSITKPLLMSNNGFLSLFQYVTSLEKLEMNGLFIRDTTEFKVLLEAIRNNRALTSLSVGCLTAMIGHRGIGDVLADTLDELHNLTELSVNSVEMTPKLQESIGKLKLTKLDFSGSYLPFTSIKPMLDKLAPTLETLRLTHSPIAIPSTVGDLTESLRKMKELKGIEVSVLNFLPGGEGELMLAGAVRDSTKKLIELGLHLWGTSASASALRTSFDALFNTLDLEFFL